MRPMKDSIGKSSAMIGAEVALGRLRAHEKHGTNSIEAISAHDPRWISILMEEVGEVAHELTYDAVGSLRKELIDVLSVATAWVASIDKDQRENSD